MKRAAAIVLAVMLAGCGGASGQGDQAAIRNVVDHFTVDVGQNQLAAACALATGQMLAVCNQLRSAGIKQLPIQSFTGLTVSKVVVTGERAVVAFSGSSEVVQLAKTTGGWKVASA